MNVSDFIDKNASFVLKYRWPIIIVNFLILGFLFSFMGKRGQTEQEHVAYMKEKFNNPLVCVDSAKVNPDHRFKVHCADGYETPKPIFDADYHVFFEDDNVDMLEYDAFQKIYAKEEQALIVVVSKSGDLFTKENLKSLKELTDRSWEVPYISRVNGVTNFNYTYVQKGEFDPDMMEPGEEPADELLVEDLVPTTELTQAEIEKKRTITLNDSLLPKFMISKKGDVTQITLTAIIPPTFSQGFVEVKEAIAQLAQEVSSKNSDLEIKLGGTIMLNASFMDFAMDDMNKMIPAMFGFILIILAITLRSFWGTVLPFFILITSVMFPVFLFVGVLNFSFTNPTMNVMQILTAVAIADAVHVLAVFYRQLRLGKTKLEAIRITIHKNFVACLLTSLTTAVGFYALILQNIPPFQDLGVFAGTGTLYAFVASLYVMPAILSILPIKASKRAVEKSQKNNALDSFFESLENWIKKYQKVIRGTAYAATVGGLYFMTQIVADSTAIKYFEEGTEFRAASEYIDGNIIGTNPIEFNFDSGEKDGIYQPEFLAKIDKFVKHIEAHPEFNITYTSSIVDVIKRLNKTMNGDNPDFYTIPMKDSVVAEGDTLRAKKLISQYMLLYEMSLPQGMELTNQLSIDKRYARVTGFMTSVSSKEQLAAVNELNEYISENFPEVKARGVGVPVMFGKLMGIAIPGMMQSLALSLLIITIILALTFKSIKVALFSMVPNVWPLVIIFGAVGLTGYVVNLSVAIVGMITLGICVDDTVHFLVKFKQARNEGKNNDEAISWTFQQVGRPLIFTSVILVVGFGVLVLSKFALNSDMGRFCSAVIALALFADFILLPAMILKFDKAKTV